MIELLFKIVLLIGLSGIVALVLALAALSWAFVIEEFKVITPSSKEPVPALPTAQSSASD